jgi:hypothetical protein
VLIHGLDRKKYGLSRDTLARLGGVPHQVMCHWHEAKHCDPAFYREHAPELHVPVLERDIVCKLLGPGARISAIQPGKRLLQGFVPHHVSGQTPGFTVYQWRNFIFGADFLVRRGDDNWVSYFSANLVQAGLQGLDTVKRLKATHWLPSKSSGPAAVPFQFDPDVISSVEQKIRKKWKVPAMPRAQRSATRTLASRVK